MKTLYKFVGEPAVATHFLRGRIKFTPIDELNDPSELMPNVIATNIETSLRRLRETGYSEEDLLYLQRQGAVLRKLAPQFQAVSVPSSVADANRLIRSPFYDQTDLLEQLLKETAKEIADKVGVFCLSKRFDSLPMWAHYAGNASGFVVEFHRLSTFFRGDETGVLWSPIEVRYEKEMGGVTFAPRSHDSIFFEKFSDWSYEQEVRVVVPLDSCETLSIKSDWKIYIVEIPTQMIARFILGWNIDPLEASRIRREVDEIGLPVEVAQARFVDGRVFVEETGH